MLEIGCGLGTDPINFARAGTEVTAVTVRSSRLASGRPELFALADKTPRTYDDHLSLLHPDYTQYRYVKEWYFRYLPQPVFAGWSDSLAGICARRRGRRSDQDIRQ